MLALSMHHVVSDEWSGRILRRELAALYDGVPRRRGRTRCRRCRCSTPTSRLWQREWLGGEVAGACSPASSRYWRDRLAGLPAAGAAHRPAPPAGPRHQRRGVGSRSPCRPRDAGLRALARASGATMFMTLLAAFGGAAGPARRAATTWCRHAVADRTEPRLEDLIGFFVNTLVLRTDLSGDPTFTELLGRVRGRRPGRLRPPGPAVRAARRRPGDRAGPLAGPPPLFQVVLGYDRDPGGEPGLSRRCTHAPSGSTPVRPSSTCPCMRRTETRGGGGSRPRSQYSTALFDPATRADRGAPGHAAGGGGGGRRTAAVGRLPMLGPEPNGTSC